MQISTIWKDWIYLLSFSHKRCSFSLHLDLSICLIVSGVHSQISLSIFIPCHTVGPSFISLSFSLFVTMTLLTLSKPKYLHCPFSSLRFFFGMRQSQNISVVPFFFLWIFFLAWVDNFMDRFDFVAWVCIDFMGGFNFMAWVWYNSFFIFR